MVSAATTERVAAGRAASQPNASTVPQSERITGTQFTPQICSGTTRDREKSAATGFVFLSPSMPVAGIASDSLRRTEGATTRRGVREAGQKIAARRLVGELHGHRLAEGNRGEVTDGGSGKWHHDDVIG